MVLVMWGTKSVFTDRSNGSTYTHWQTGALLFSVVIVTVHLEISTIMDHWTWLHLVSVLGSVRKCLLPRCPL
jgi:hypothetical protein